MVELTEDAGMIVIEGDEYLSSPLDMRSKFLHYRPHVAVLSGIAWDHMNVSKRTRAIRTLSCALSRAWKRARY